MIIIIIILIIVILILTQNIDTFSNEKESKYIIYDSINNKYYNIISLTQLDFDIQDKIINYIKSKNIKNILYLDFIQYQISKKNRYSITNNILFAYPITNNKPDITVTDSINFMINNNRERTDYTFGTYDNTLLLYKKDDPYNIKNNITINENNMLNNVELEKMNDLDLYIIKLSNSSNMILQKIDI